jgi:acetylornithine deacetylase
MGESTKKGHNKVLKIQPRRLKKLLRHLIDIYSPSGKEEEILEFLHGYLRRRHLPVIKQEVDESRYNLLVIPETNEICLGLIGHLDTVAAYDIEHYGYSEDGDIISGLGAADMKSGCAAMVESYLALWDIFSSRIPVALAMVVGEEEDGDGARQLVKDYYFPWVIIGEPTDLKPCLGHYGYLEIQMLTRGKRAHASLANRGQNSVEAMLKLLLEFTLYMEERRPAIVYNIRDLYTSPAGFVVPDRCEVWIDTHVPQESSIHEITKELDEIIAEQRSKNPHLDMSQQYTTIHSGYDIHDKGSVVDSLHSVYRNRSLSWEPQIFRSHSDASIFWEAKTKPIILGPGQIEQAHIPEESVSFKKVYSAAEIYTDCLISLIK